MSRGARIVVACEAARSLAWRLYSALSYAVGEAWPDTTLGNRVIKLIGAAGVLWGAWALTRAPVPLSPSSRVATRLLAALGAAGSAARILLAAEGINEWVSEPVSMLVDALAMIACAACSARLLGSAGDPRGARSTWACSAAYLLATVLRVIVLAPAWGFVAANRASTVLSVAMLALGLWAWTLASRLRATPSAGAR